MTAGSSPELAKPPDYIPGSEHVLVAQEQHLMRQANRTIDEARAGLRQFFEFHEGKTTSFSGDSSHYLIRDTDKILPFHTVVGLPESSPKAGIQTKHIQHQELTIVKALDTGVAVDIRAGDVLPIIIYGTIDFVPSESLDEVPFETRLKA